MATQRGSSSAIVKIREGSGLPLVNGPSVAKMDYVYEVVLKMEDRLLA